MPRSFPIVESAAPPDPEAAAGAILPLFLAFLDGRLVRKDVRADCHPQEGNDEGRQHFGGR